MGEVKDFSKKKSVRFKVDHVGGAQEGEADFFDGVPNMPALSLIEFALAYEKIGEDAQQDPDLFRKIFELVLTDESVTRFLTRLESKIDPIGMDQLIEIIPWLMEEYGMRPTKLSGPSSEQPSNPDNGTSSTPSSSEQVPTSAPSLESVS